MCLVHGPLSVNIGVMIMKMLVIQESSPDDTCDSS